MHSKIHFYQPGQNEYCSEVSLWALGREIINPDGVRWLETHWTSSDNTPGLALFTSRLDAIIACQFMNKHTNNSWRVYPFRDLNVTEMMVNIRSHHNERQYCTGLTFGFSANSASQPIHYQKNLRNNAILIDFAISDTLLPSQSVQLSFPLRYFERINKFWHAAFDDYCKVIAAQNELPEQLLERHAQAALIQADIFTTSSRYCGFADRVTTYCLNTHSWVVSCQETEQADSTITLH